MLYTLARRALFALESETAHATTLAALRVSGYLNRPKRRLPAGDVELAGLCFPSRVGLAAGFDKNGSAVDGLSSLGFGFVEIGTVTPRAQPGNPRPRVFRLPRSRSLINRMGFPNQGAEAIAARLSRRPHRGVLGINIGKNADTPAERAVDDYLACFHSLHPVADYIAVNVSSPNTAGLRDLQQVHHLELILSALLEARTALRNDPEHAVPLFVKLAPDLTPDELLDIARLIRRLEIDGVIATNTTVRRDMLPRSADATESGGLSGPPLFPLALGAVRTLRTVLPSAVIIGCGGIESAADALAMREAGADLVQLYTALIYHGPRLIRDIASALGDRGGLLKWSG